MGKNQPPPNKRGAPNQQESVSASITPIKEVRAFTSTFCFALIRPGKLLSFLFQKRASKREKKEIIAATPAGDQTPKKENRMFFVLSVFFSLN